MKTKGAHRVDPFFKCPRGHQLPNQTERGPCTPVLCGNADGSKGRLEMRVGEKKTHKAYEKKRLALKAALPDDEVTKLVKGEANDLAVDAARQSAAEAKAEQLIRMGHAAGRFAARAKFVGLPEGLQGAEAEEWADKRLIDLLPAAVAELEYQLKLGDDKQRIEAADKVLSANGRSRRDGGGLGTAPIIILTGGAVVQPPWRSPSSGNSSSAVSTQVVQVVQGQLTKGEKDDA